MSSSSSFLSFCSFFFLCASCGFVEKQRGEKNFSTSSPGCSDSPAEPDTAPCYESCPQPCDGLCESFEQGAVPGAWTPDSEAVPGGLYYKGERRLWQVWASSIERSLKP